MPLLALQAERSVVSVRDTVQLVQLELAVGTPDALLRARNLAAACAEQARRNPRNNIIIIVILFIPSVQYIWFSFRDK